jgi:hypothetical protein
MPCVVENPKSSAQSKIPTFEDVSQQGGAVTKIHVHAETKPLTGTINPRPADANTETNSIGSITATLPSIIQSR